jgi:hypothetical protein
MSRIVIEPYNFATPFAQMRKFESSSTPYTTMVCGYKVLLFSAYLITMVCGYKVRLFSAYLVAMVCGYKLPVFSIPYNHGLWL